jgi:hypothetical protein
MLWTYICDRHAEPVKLPVVGWRIDDVLNSFCLSSSLLATDPHVFRVVTVVFIIIVVVHIIILIFIVVFILIFLVFVAVAIAVTFIFFFFRIVLIFNVLVTDLVQLQVFFVRLGHLFVRLAIEISC